MSRFSHREKTAAKNGEKPYTIALPGGREEPVLIRATSAMEDMESRRFAIGASKSRGSANPVDGDALYDMAFWAATVAKSFLDPESPAEGRAPFFADAGEVLNHLPAEGIAYLFQVQQKWQEEVAPTFKALSPGQLVESIEKTAREDGEVFFSRCSPATQTVLAHFMAVLIVSSPDTSWRSGSPSGTSPTSSSGAPKTLRPRRHPRPHADPRT